jgi:Superinfection immunity protein
MVNGIKITVIQLIFTPPGYFNGLLNEIPSFPSALLKVVYSDGSNLKRLIMLAYSLLCTASTNSLSAVDNSWLIACLFTAIYFAPALVAFFRHQQNRRFILALNFLFGWTVIGWIICLAWAARAPSGEPVVIVQTAPQPPPASAASFRSGPGTAFTALPPDVSEGIPFESGAFPFRRPHSIKLAVFRLAVAVISLAVVVTASQRKPKSSSLSTSLPRDRIHHVPQIRNIDPYVPGSASATPQRRYPSPASRSHEGYY